MQSSVHISNMTSFSADIENCDNVIYFFVILK